MTANKGIVKGFFWSYAERITAQLVSILVSIILARLLNPNHYGIIAIVMIFITLCNALVTGGFGNSLVQKKEADDLDFNTMLGCSVVVSLCLYAFLFFSAPFIANFYDMPLLRPVIRVLGLRIPISGINSIQQAKVQRDFSFEKYFFATLIGTITSAVIGIVMAYKGCGVWALVTQYLTNTAIDTLVLLLTDRWKISFQFSISRAKSLLGFGWKVMLMTVVFTLENDIRSLIVGKVFGPDDLAYYDQGKRFPNLIITNINSSISKVLFPALSSVQDGVEKLKRLCRHAIRVGSFILCPLLIGLIALADTFVEIVLTEKWMPCVPYLRILTLVFLVRPLTTTCQQAILAIGRSDITLRIEIIINSVCIMLTVIAVYFYENVICIAWAAVVSEVISVYLFLRYSSKLIGYRFSEQMHDLLPVLGISIIMGIVVISLGFLPIKHVMLFTLQIVVGIIVYLVLAIAFKFDAMKYLLEITNNHIKNRLLEIIIKIMD